MNRKGDKALIVGLDIGTSKVVALVGEYSPGNPIEVIGIGSSSFTRYWLKLKSGPPGIATGVLMR